MFSSLSPQAPEDQRSPQHHQPKLWDSGFLQEVAGWVRHYSIFTAVVTGFEFTDSMSVLIRNTSTDVNEDYFTYDITEDFECIRDS